ncbi:MAG: CoA-binding protein, partial [Nitrospirota bacterium]
MLNSLFNPDSIAVIGASRDPKKVGYAVLNNLIRFGYKGQIYPVNPSGEEILGLKSFSNLSDIGGKIALAVIAVPAKFVPETIIKSADAGAGAVVILSAGFKEAGPEGVRLEQELGKISRERNIRILGPNCLGIINTSNNMNATFAAGMLPKGKLAFFSQSGALGIAILDWAIGNKIGFSKFISLGNKTDLNEIDFIEYFINDPETDIILGYIEDVVDGRRFLEIAKKATKTKPVILLKSGGTEAGARAASSHTGALAGSEHAFDAAFKQPGVIRAQ